MSRNSFRHLAVGSFLLCCSTACAQNWYPPTQQPIATPPQPNQGYARPPNFAGPNSYQVAPQAVPQYYAAGQFELPAPSAYGPTPQQPAPPVGQLPAAGGFAPQAVNSAPVGVNVGSSCGDGSCGNQNVVGYGSGGFGGPMAFAGSGGGAPFGPGLGYGGSGVINASGQTSGGAGFFFRYDRLYSSISAPGLRTIGSAAAEGNFLVGGAGSSFFNSFDTGFADDDFEFNGNRVEFGFFDSGRASGNGGSGWVASILQIDQDTTASAGGGTLLFDDPFGLLLGYVDGNGDGIDDDLNNNNIYGRFGEDIGIANDLGVFSAPPFDGEIDTPAPDDSGDLVSWIPIYNTLTVRSNTRLSGLALSRIRPSNRSGRLGNGYFRWLYGVRYLNLRDEFSIDALGGFTENDETHIRGLAKNFIIGPELGFSLGRYAGPWSFDGQLRFTAGTNFLRTRQSGVVFDGLTAGELTGQNQPLNLSTITFNTTAETEQFSAIAEWRAGVAYALSRNLSLRAGYTGMLIGNVGRGTGITYTLPSFGVAGGRSDIYVHSLTFGGEFAY